MRLLLKNPHKFSGISLWDRVPSKFKHLFDHQLIDLFERMLEVDPEYRLTISEVLEHPYFDRVKRLPKMAERKPKPKEIDEEVKEKEVKKNARIPVQKDKVPRKNTLN